MTDHQNQKKQQQSVMFVIVFIISFCLNSVRSILTDYYPNAWIVLGGLEGKNNPFKYIDDTLLWRDIPSSGLISEHPEAQICVNGIYLLYGEPDFDVTEPENVKILSGIDKCLPAYSISSVQSAQTYGPIFTKSLVIFPRKYLGGNAFNVESSVLDVNAKFAGTLESVLLIGKLSWTLETSSGKAHCLKPVPDAKFMFPICAVTNFGNNDIQASIQSIYKGCAKDVPVLEVPDCVEFGGDSFKDFDIDEKDDKNSTAVIEYDETEDKTGGDGDGGNGDLLPDSDRFTLECDNDKDFLELLDMFMNDNLYDLYQMRFPKDKKQFMRGANIITYLFDIAEFICTGNNPIHFSKVYLRFFREAFIFVYEKYGKSVPEPSSIDPHDMNYNLIRACWDTTLNSARPLSFRLDDSSLNYAFQAPYQWDVGVEMDERAKRKNFTEVDNLLSNYGTLDVAVEVMWLVSNLVVSTCHNTLMGATDLWADLYPYLHELFFEPMKEHWQNPNRFLYYYNVLLSGNNYEGTLKHLRMCTANVITYMNLEVFQRPFNETPVYTVNGKNNGISSEDDATILLDLPGDD